MIDEEKKKQFANMCARRLLVKIEEDEIVEKINEIIFENERLHSIIKEVREYTDKLLKKYWSDDNRVIVAEKINEILDKVGDIK